MTLSFATEARTWDVVGVGDIDVDLYLGVPVLAGPDEKVGAELLGEHPGGMIANVCCAASRFCSLPSSSALPPAASSSVIAA